MTTKQNIDFGTNLVDSHKKILETIADLRKNKDDQKSIDFLLEITEIEYKGRLERDSENLARHKKNYLTEFEHASLECNVHLDKMVKGAKQLIGTTLPGVTGVIEEIKPLTDQYDDKEKWMFYTQEQRNDLYFKLKAILSAIDKIKH